MEEVTDNNNILSINIEQFGEGPESVPQKIYVINNFDRHLGKWKMENRKST